MPLITKAYIKNDGNERFYSFYYNWMASIMLGRTHYGVEIDLTRDIATFSSTSWGPLFVLGYMPFVNTSPSSSHLSYEPLVLVGCHEEF